MRRITALAILVPLLSGCYHLIAAEQRERQQRLEADLLAVTDGVIREAERRGSRSFAELFREMTSRYEAVYSRYGMQMDPFDQAYLSYAVALGGRVDRREISPDEFKYLLDKLDADMKLERAKLAAQYQAATPRYYDAWGNWWNNYWRILQEETIRRSLRSPVSCSIRSYGGGVSYVDCY